MGGVDHLVDLGRRSVVLLEEGPGEVEQPGGQRALGGRVELGWQ